MRVSSTVRVVPMGLCYSSGTGDQKETYRPTGQATCDVRSSNRVLLVAPLKERDSGERTWEGYQSRHRPRKNMTAGPPRRHASFHRLENDGMGFTSKLLKHSTSKNF